MAKRARGVTVVVAVLMGACGHGGAVKDRFRADYGCANVSIQSIGGTSYRATGCGKQATYTCVTSVSRGLGAEQSTCVRDYTPEPRRTAAARASRPRASRKSTVERRYDEARGLKSIYGRFPAGSSATIKMMGVPAAALGTVMVAVSASGMRLASDCDALEVLVNGIPTTGTGLEADQANGKRILRAKFDFQTFKPLAKSSPAFAVRACKFSEKLDAESVQAVREFFSIYAELATEAQGDTGEATTGETPRDEDANGSLTL